MSSSRATCLTLSIILGAIKVMVFAMEAAAHKTIVPPSLGSIISVAIQLSWTAYWALHIQDTVRNHSTARASAILDAIAAAVDQAACQGATDARIDLMRRIGTQPDANHINNQTTRPTLVT